jgi:hydrogenase maturation protein HypF
MAAAALHRLGLLTQQTQQTQRMNAIAPQHVFMSTPDSALGQRPRADFVSAHLRVGTPGHMAASNIQGVRSMLLRGVNCPITTSAGRWFDAVAGLLGVCWWQIEEAQAAIALERLATQWLCEHRAPALDAELVHAGLNLDVLLLRLMALLDSVASDPAAYRAMQAQAAALFHVALADALARTAIEATQVHGISAIALSGGCFFNRTLRTLMLDTLTQAGLVVLMPNDSAYGDSGLALGQAWVAAHSLHNPIHAENRSFKTGNSLCV